MHLSTSTVKLTKKVRKRTSDIAVKHGGGYMMSSVAVLFRYLTLSSLGLVSRTVIQDTPAAPQLWSAKKKKKRKKKKKGDITFF